MKNQTQAGDAIYVVSPAGFTSGNAYLIGTSITAGFLFGVAGATVTTGQTGVLWVVGCFTLPKLAADVWAVGDTLWWDNTNFWLTKTSNTGANMLVARAIAPALAASTSGNCRLIPG